jgi:hypothetical protein
VAPTGSVGSAKSPAATTAATPSGPPEERTLEEADQEAEHDRAGGAREAQRDLPPDHAEVTVQELDGRLGESE